jgi:ADP-ribose pyrophosphatase YjhB (NUDIX family)
LDPNESLLEAIQREVWEETGIESEVDSWKMESLWESVYPTTLSEDDVDEDGLFPATAIKAHHVVVYLSTILSEEKPSLALCKEEVDAAVWLSRDNCRTLVNRDFASAESSKLSFQSSTANLKGDVVPLRHLMGIYPQALSDGKRGGMAQGSLFALEEFLCSL